MLFSALPLNTNWRTHLKLSLVVAVWLVVFLVLVAPFDTADLSLSLRLLLLPPYGLLFILTYLPVVLLQNRLYQHLGYWNLLLETSTILVTYGLVLLFSYAYYKTDIIRGTFTFWQFVATVYLPTLLLLSFLLIFGRWFISRGTTAAAAPGEGELLLLRGSNKQDVLRLRPEELICICGAQNYAEVHYFEAGKLTRKLLRITLTKLGKQVPGLVRVHRSYLINPAHVTRWAGPATIVLAGLEIPVAQQYREKLEVLLTKG